MASSSHIPNQSEETMTYTLRRKAGITALAALALQVGGFS